jgi:purine-binding chemotaxis protein CheW
VQGESFTVLVFDVAGQRHGLPASDVQELLRAVAVVELPRAPPGVEGIINLRGQVVPVVSMRGRVGQPERPLEPADHFIVARAAGRLLALRVDRALDLVQLGPGDLDPVPDTVKGAGVSWLARLSDGLVPVHDLQGLLTRAEAAILADVLPPEKGGQS